MIEYIKEKCKNDLQQIEENEPDNYRLKRKSPLCKQVYGFHGNLAETDEITR